MDSGHSGSSAVRRNPALAPRHDHQGHDRNRSKKQRIRNAQEHMVLGVQINLMPLDLMRIDFTDCEVRNGGPSSYGLAFYPNDNQPGNQPDCPDGFSSLLKNRERHVRNLHAV